MRTMEISTSNRARAECTPAVLRMLPLHTAMGGCQTDLLPRLIRKFERGTTLDMRGPVRAHARLHPELPSGSASEIEPSLLGVTTSSGCFVPSGFETVMPSILGLLPETYVIVVGSSFHPAWQREALGGHGAGTWSGATSPRRLPRRGTHQRRRRSRHYGRQGAVAEACRNRVKAVKMRSAL